MPGADLTILSAKMEGLLKARSRQIKSSSRESKALLDENNNPTFEYAHEFHTSEDGAYTVVATLEQSNVNPGGTVAVYVYITGYGNTNWNKLYITLSAREFLVENELSEEELIDESEGSEPKNRQDTRREALTIDEAFEQRKIAGKVTVRMVDPAGLSRDSRGNMFEHGGTLVQKSMIESPTSSIVFPHQVFAIRGSKSKSQPGFYTLTSEDSWAGEEVADDPSDFDNSTIEYEFNINDHARSGDYEISLTFTYYNGSEIRQDQSKVAIHVNSWVEQHRPVLQQLAVGVPIGILTLGALRFLLSLYSTAIIPWWAFIGSVLLITAVVAYSGQWIATELDLGNPKSWVQNMMKDKYN